jgi:hypothetical protein
MARVDYTLTVEVFWIKTEDAILKPCRICDQIIVTEAYSMIAHFKDVGQFKEGSVFLCGSCGEAAKIKAVG